MITWHVQTSSGSRFEYADDEEQMRRQMIEYYNDTCRDTTQDEKLAEDTEFDDVREAIEVYENFSYEEVHESCLPKVFVAVFDSDNGTQTSVHLSHRKAIEWVMEQAGVTFAPEHIPADDMELSTMVSEALERSEDWFVINHEEIQQ